MRPAHILLLCDEAARHIGTVNDHILAFKRYSKSRVVVIDSRAAAALDLELEAFDAVVFHYSIVIAMPTYLPPSVFAQLAAVRCPKILFIQDEYRWVDRTALAIRDLGISVVFTVVNADAIRAIYKEPWFDDVRFEETLTGFVPEDLLATKVPEYSSRPIDVSYRARRVPSWLGAFGQEKWTIGERFLRESSRYGLKCDIAMSENSRIYGKSWIEFVANSKAVLGTESGASFIDFSGDAQRQVEAFEKANPSADFKEIQARFLPGDGNTVIHVISPRCFEAAALRTLMILYPGSYSGVLVPHRHYVPLCRDHSNMDEVAATIRDPARARSIIDAAYEEVACSSAWTFEVFVEKFDRVVAEEIEKCRLGSHGGRVAPSSQSISDDLELTFDRLEQQSKQIAKSRIGAMAWALRLQRLSRGFGSIVHRALPARFAARAMSTGAAVSDAIKPVLKRMLFGRSE